jgi:hypothetical protein
MNEALTRKFVKGRGCKTLKRSGTKYQQHLLKILAAVKTSISVCASRDRLE